MLGSTTACIEGVRLKNKTKSYGKIMFINEDRSYVLIEKNIISHTVSVEQVC